MSYSDTITKLNQSAGRPRMSKAYELAGAGGFIRPDLLAAKLEAIQMGEFPRMHLQLRERPRLAEALLFAQWKSYQSGGLQKLAREMVDAFPQRIGLRSVRNMKPMGRTGFTDIQMWTLVEGVDSRVLRAMGYPAVDIDESVADEARKDLVLGGRFRNPDEWRDFAVEKFITMVPGYLAHLCQSEFAEFSERENDLWCFDGFLDALIDYLDRHAAVTAGSIADTSIRERMANEFSFTQSQRIAIRIIGDTRIGKTTIATNLCAMWPGKMRYLEVPSGQDMSAFDRALVQSLGELPTPTGTTQHLRQMAQYCYRATGLMLVVDEAQFLYPSNFTERTRPRRLDFLRTAFIDQHVPCVLITTPQGIEDWASFDEKTHYNSDQFKGRLSLTVDFPKKVPEEDVNKVAVHLMRGYPLAWAQKIAGRAFNTPTSLKTVQAIYLRACWYSQGAHREQISIEDLRAACDDIVPLALVGDLPGKVPVTKTAPTTPSTRKGFAGMSRPSDFKDTDEAVRGRRDDAVLLKSS
ncbi:AAA family ATPase [bacterium]|nr:AAA family ATPase [bacterium]